MNEWSFELRSRSSLSYHTTDWWSLHSEPVSISFPGDLILVDTVGGIEGEVWYEFS
jgi:hypothetical protein